ncbi:MAG: UDP-N-acetylglucosamine--LPS N-acetylglucosamine transferase [Gammaproteobacteria bacterium]|nr:UDP-N-acetylglucosamine--LPS N-acetylglucosamine transferase [Gammaproteobacteria bacterium]
MLVQRPIRVLALASSGGHWIQLRRLRPAWLGCDVAYATSNAGYRSEIEEEEVAPGLPAPRFYSFPDASRWQKARLILQLLSVIRILLLERPDVVITTGASAGYFALRIAKLFGRRTVWLDSIANSAELSLSGQRVARYADLWLTQWDHLVAPLGKAGPAPSFRGQVL